MTSPLLLTAGLALALWPFHAPQTVTRAFSQPIWRMTIRADRFTGAVQCRVFQGARSRPDVAYARQSLAFRFGRGVNTLEASYRIDSHPAIAWSTVYPTLTNLGANLPGGRMDNPTGGLVLLPVSALVGAHGVTIRPTPGSRPRAFAIDGLADTLANARARGCSTDAAFVR